MLIYILVILVDFWFALIFSLSCKAFARCAGKSAYTEFKTNNKCVKVMQRNCHGLRVLLPKSLTSLYTQGFDSAWKEAGGNTVIVPVMWHQLCPSPCKLSGSRGTALRVQCKRPQVAQCG
ncbi:UNVERIFIED_CONTAM: hypothetical protein K2H54_060364 [Gekko kuhli]